MEYLADMNHYRIFKEENVTGQGLENEYCYSLIVEMNYSRVIKQIRA